MENLLIMNEVFTDIFGESYEIRKFLASPFNYTGAKTKLLDQIIEYLPSDIDVFCDLFCGGGSVFVNVDARKKIANDVITPLIEFYRFIQDTKWDSVIEIVRQRNIPKDDHGSYNSLRDQFNQTGNCIDFFILMCSCTNNMMRFNKKFKFNQTWGKRHFNDNTERKLKAYYDVIRNSDIEFYNESFCDIEFKKNWFVYLDPPYLITEAGYNAYWSQTLEDRLYELLNELDATGVRFMMSNVAEHKGKVNPSIEKIKRFNIVELEFDYNKVSRRGKSNSKEILVTNY